MLLERPVFSFFSKLIMPLFYDKKFLRGRWFEESSLGWTWCWRNLWMQTVKGINRDIPFPVSFRNEVSSAENLIFDPDDMNDFNAFGCYFQNFAAKIVIGKGSYIAPNVGLVTANHVLTDLEQHQPAKPRGLKLLCKAICFGIEEINHFNRIFKSIVAFRPPSTVLQTARKRRTDLIFVKLFWVDTVKKSGI